MMIPSIVRNDRILLARSAESATLMVSQIMPLAPLSLHPRDAASAETLEALEHLGLLSQ